MTLDEISIFTMQTALTEWCAQRDLADKMVDEYGAAIKACYAKQDEWRAKRRDAGIRVEVIETVLAARTDAQGVE